MHTFSRKRSKQKTKLWRVWAGAARDGRRHAHPTCSPDLSIKPCAYPTCKTAPINTEAEGCQSHISSQVTTRQRRRWGWMLISGCEILAPKLLLHSQTSVRKHYWFSVRGFFSLFFLFFFLDFCTNSYRSKNVGWRTKALLCPKPVAVDAKEACLCSTQVYFGRWLEKNKKNKHLLYIKIHN